MIELYELAGADPGLRFSPYCWRIRMALAHKGLDADTIPWHLGEQTLPDGGRTVPILVDDGRVFQGSLAIAHHLEHAYPNGPSLFGGEGGEPHVAFIAAWADTVLQPALFPLIAVDILALVKPEARAYFRDSREARLGTTLEQAAEGREEARPAVAGILTPVRRVLQHAPFLGGDEPSYADYCVFGAFMWARCVSEFDPLEPGDPVSEWREEMLDLFDGLARDAEAIGDEESVA